MWVSYFFLYIYIYLFVFVVVCVGGTKCNAPVNVNPVGGGGAGNGWGFDGEIHPSVGGLIDYLCSGVGTFVFFGRETGTKFQRVNIVSSIFFGKGVEFGVKCSTITLNCKFVCIVTFNTAMMM